MAEINFQRIAARCGSQSNAFEELCSQLARQVRPEGSIFERFRGSGGDGGVECIACLSDKSITGWQVKYVFDVNGLIRQSKKSLKTAFSIHKNLNRYIICFPFDPTGKTARTSKTGRPTKNDSEKLNEFVSKEIQNAKQNGRDLKIELWPSSKIQSILLSKDISGGIRQYFFNETILSPDWFRNHINTATKAAGPRYTCKLNVQTDLWKWFSSFERGDIWHDNFELILEKCRKAIKDFQRQININRKDPANPPWPKNKTNAGKDSLRACNEILYTAQLLYDNSNENRLNEFSSDLMQLLDKLRDLELVLAQDLDIEHGEGSSNSKQFRTYMAEYMVCFPAANLDTVRDVIKVFNELADWLKSPEGFLAFTSVFILTGAGGSGKTHGICDIAIKRLEYNAFSCVLFGHQFGGQPAEWTRLIESLGLPTSIGKDCMLDMLSAAAEASGKYLLFCIDAVNETRPRDYWQHRFLPLAHDFECRSFLKLCISCRTSFLSACLPHTDPYAVVEHRGFAGIERQACNAFFNYYNLEPPLVPVLQPELSNPLYLKLVCKTLKLKGLKRLPSGWFGLRPVIEAFLIEKEKTFAVEHSISAGAKIVSGSLLAIANTIAQSGNDALSWSDSQRVITKMLPQAATLPVLEWLVKEDLLIEDGPAAIMSFAGENILRPAFERFGDFLIATALLQENTSDRFIDTFLTRIQQFLATPSTIEANAGIIQALSILLPETKSIELPNLIKDTDNHEIVLAFTMHALPWRTPDSFSRSTCRLVEESLSKNEWKRTMNSLLSVSAYSSEIDACWLSYLLSTLPISSRDSFWCSYLHQNYEENGIVKRLIEATKDFDIARLDSETAFRWTLILIWFTAAADRRIKDLSTRAAIAILRAHPQVTIHLVERLLNIDDDEIRERVLLCVYGVLIVVRDKEIIKTISEFLLNKYQSSPSDFQNAIIRDHIRCLGELALHLECLDTRLDPSITTKHQIHSEWPITLPSKEQLEEWKNAKNAVRYVTRSCLFDDFNHYSINCLDPWMHQINKQAIGSWIIKHIVEEFGFENRSFDLYDSYMVSRGGGGRSKPVWAERIGKKYQWIGLYRLASRLNDNVNRDENSSEPKPVREPLILMEERKIDPTISSIIVPVKKDSECWWLHDNVNLQTTKDLGYAKWVTKQDDLPLLENLLQTTDHKGQRWIILTASPDWSEYQSDVEFNKPYRDTWIQLSGFLVPDTQFKKAINALNERNYFGAWLPEGGRWLHTFAGEYPWATACNTEPDWYLGASETTEKVDLQLIHSSNTVVIEWEYDATLPSSIYLEVPTKKLFSLNDLWWNGVDGFSNADGKTIFFDPHISGRGSNALLADFDDLQWRLKKICYRIVWTMLGEKRILNATDRNLQQICYSQLAWLAEDGSVKVGKRCFFKDYDKDVGFAK
ncbi:MAG: hypothetical protein JXI43_04735 [Tissierellales bacterium]|nr:hypothetical protein [Tissierellales bacterium]